MQAQVRDRWEDEPKADRLSVSLASVIRYVTNDVSTRSIELNCLLRLVNFSTANQIPKATISDNTLPVEPPFNSRRYSSSTGARAWSIRGKFPRGRERLFSQISSQLLHVVHLVTFRCVRLAVSRECRKILISSRSQSRRVFVQSASRRN